MKVANKFTLSSSKGRSFKGTQSNHMGLLKAVSFLWLGAEGEIEIVKVEEGLGVTLLH